MLIPIQQLIKGTQALTSRQFNTKIKIHSSDELGQLAADFNTMAQTLERYEQMRQQWLSDISHELRTPLSIMRGEIEAMQDGIRDFSNDALDSLHLEVQRMNRIVDDLRELSLAETEMLSFKKVPINPLQILRKTLKLFHTRLTQNNIQVQDDLQADENIILQGDADRLSQLFSNLLENTLRYVDSPGTLKIWHKQIETQLFLNLIDSGPGVPEESIGRLFDRLYRVEQSRNRAKGGSGLGLAICKNIVEMHGGEITATHAPDGGLWIKIMFPLL
jgi:two-component system sensor histidine kinase BaeS